MSRTIKRADGRTEWQWWQDMTKEHCGRLQCEYKAEDATRLYNLGRTPLRAAMAMLAAFQQPVAA